MKVDAHVHVTPPEISANLDKYLAREPYFALLSSNPKNRFATAEDVVAELDRAGFDRAVVFGFAFQDPGLCRMVNDYVIEKVAAYPQRLSGFAVVQPSSRGAAHEIERTHEAGLRGVGELFPSGQCFDIADSSLTSAFTGVCAELGMPVLVHANEPVGHQYPGKTDTTLRQLELFVEHSPDNDIILAHWGGGLLYFETMPEIREKFTRVFYDCAASPFLYDARVYRIACELGIEAKILFGSDYPLLPITRYIPEIEASGITDRAKTLLLGENCRRILGN